MGGYFGWAMKGIGMSCEMQPIADSLYTITADDGKEFAEREYIAHEPGIDFFFAHPFATWERGTNEYMNGLSDNTALNSPNLPHH